MLIFQLTNDPVKCKKNLPIWQLLLQSLKEDVEFKNLVTRRVMCDKKCIKCKKCGTNKFYNHDNNTNRTIKPFSRDEYERD